MNVVGFLKKPAKSFFVLKQHGLLEHLSDETYLKWMYKAHTGKKLDLVNPKGFNEKLQWLKLHDRNPQYSKMVDKYEAKEYVEKIIGGGVHHPYAWSMGQL